MGDRFFYIFFCNLSKNPFVASIESESFTPIKSRRPISALISIDGVRQGQRRFYAIRDLNVILKSNQYFYDMPDGIFSVDDYHRLIDRSLKLYGPHITFSFTPRVAAAADCYEFEIQLAGITKQFKISRTSHYVAEDELVQILNELLQIIDPSSAKAYCALRNDFGIAIVTPDQKEDMIDQGFS
jgi:hypothetical protein